MDYARVGVYFMPSWNCNIQRPPWRGLKQRIHELRRLTGASQRRPIRAANSKQSSVLPHVISGTVLENPLWRHVHTKYHDSVCH